MSTQATLATVASKGCCDSVRGIVAGAIADCFATPMAGLNMNNLTCRSNNELRELPQQSRQTLTDISWQSRQSPRHAERHS